MAEKIWRAGIGFRPPPAFRLYFRSFDRWRTGISGSTFTQNSSDTSQDFICGILGHNLASTGSAFQHLFTDTLLVVHLELSQKPEIGHHVPKRSSD
jgi:hypothetical protein